MRDQLFIGHNYVMDENGNPYFDKIYQTPITMAPKFLELIDCPEFKRLKKITQNGFSSIDWPGLEENNRYKHSVGVFYLLNCMIDSLTIKLHEHHITIPQEDKEIAIAAMLLHDIGHGPFSHLSERVTKYSHEKRTADIILGDTQINKILLKHFSPDTVQRIAKFISAENASEIGEGSNFLAVLKKLISSQLDADRIDYTLRDTHHAGNKSAVDWAKLIDSMGITVKADGKYEIVIDQKNISHAETLLFERYKNYRDVYFCNSAIIAEHAVFEMLIDRVANLIQNGDSVHAFLSKPFLNFVLHPQTLTLEEYLQLDNDVVYEGFDALHKHCSDSLVQYLTEDRCRTVVKDFVQIRKTKPVEIHQKITEEYFGTKDANSLGCFVTRLKVPIYKNKKADGIKIDVGGDIVDITEASAVIKMDINLREEIRLFLNQKLLNLEAYAREKKKENLKELIKESAEDKEFESKYALTANLAPAQVIQVLTNHNFVVKGEEDVLNDDLYFDSAAFDMLKRKGSLRVRRALKEGKVKFKATYKMPVSTSEVQMFSERDEIERSMTEATYEGLMHFLNTENIQIIPLPTPVLRAQTNRRNILLKKYDKEYQLSFDETEYSTIPEENKKSKTVHDSMIEIEALGKTENRVGLIEINEILSKANLPIKPITASKYETGIRAVQPECVKQVLPE